MGQLILKYGRKDSSMNASCVEEGPRKKGNPESVETAEVYDEPLPACNESPIKGPDMRPRSRKG